MKQNKENMCISGIQLLLNHSNCFGNCIQGHITKNGTFEPWRKFIEHGESIKLEQKNKSEIYNIPWYTKLLAVTGNLQVILYLTLHTSLNQTY